MGEVTEGSRAVAMEVVAMGEEMAEGRAEGKAAARAAAARAAVRAEAMAEARAAAARAAVRAAVPGKLRLGQWRLCGSYCEEVLARSRRLPTGRRRDQRLKKRGGCYRIAFEIERSRKTLS